MKGGLTHAGTEILGCAALKIQVHGSYQFVAMHVDCAMSFFKSKHGKDTPTMHDLLVAMKKIEQVEADEFFKQIKGFMYHGEVKENTIMFVP